MYKGNYIRLMHHLLYLNISVDNLVFMQISDPL